MARQLNPREVYLEGRQQARQGRTIYTSNRHTIAFPERVDRRVRRLAEKWDVPVAEMFRYLVLHSLDAVEQMQVPEPKEDQPIRKEVPK